MPEITSVASNLHANRRAEVLAFDDDLEVPPEGPFDLLRHPCLRDNVSFSLSALAAILCVNSDVGRAHKRISFEL